MKKEKKEKKTVNYKKPGNLHAKGPANKDKAKHKIENMLCHKLIA